MAQDRDLRPGGDPRRGDRRAAGRHAPDRRRPHPPAAPRHRGGGAHDRGDRARGLEFLGGSLGGSTQGAGSRGGARSSAGVVQGRAGQREGCRQGGEATAANHGSPYGEVFGPVSGGSASGCCGRLSVISCQGAFEATKVWYWGRMPGSPSTVPSRIEISFPSGHIPPKRLEPHTPQKTLTAASGAGRYTTSRSAPETSRKSSRRTRPWVPTAAPLCFRQREQWQCPARRKGPLTT